MNQLGLSWHKISKLRDAEFLRIMQTRPTRVLNDKLKIVAVIARDNFKAKGTMQAFGFEWFGRLSEIKVELKNTCSALH